MDFFMRFRVDEWDDDYEDDFDDDTWEEEEWDD